MLLGPVLLWSRVAVLFDHSPREKRGFFPLSDLSVLNFISMVIQGTLTQEYHRFYPLAEIVRWVVLTQLLA